VTNPEATQMLYSMYPAPVKRWISQRGGLTPHMIFLRGKQLQTMYKPCYMDAQASVTKPQPVPLDAAPNEALLPAQAQSPARPSR